MSKSFNEKEQLKELKDFVQNSERVKGKEMTKKFVPENIISIKKWFQVSYIPNSVGMLKNLVYLNMTGGNATYLPDSICSLKKLKCLIAIDMKITALPDDIGDLCSLEYLDISENSINYLPSSITNLRSLDQLLLSDNKISEFPNDFENLNSIRRLKMNGNEFEQLPEVVYDLPNLYWLEISSRLKYQKGRSSSIKRLTRIGKVDMEIFTHSSFLELEDESDIFEKKIAFFIILVFFVIFAFFCYII